MTAVRRRPHRDVALEVEKLAVLQELVVVGQQRSIFLLVEPAERGVDIGDRLFHGRRVVHRVQARRVPGSEQHPGPCDKLSSFHDASDRHDS
ncbi:MAG: hypothetical protein ACREOC_01340 [Gemmatimonadales bacterium]